MTPDVNVLVAASRSDYPHHGVALDWMALPGVQLAPLGPEWSTLRQLCLDKQLSGNDLPDAWLSAAVTHRGEHLVTFDRDLRKLLTRSQFTLLAPK